MINSCGITGPTNELVFARLNSYFAFFETEVEDHVLVVSEPFAGSVLSIDLFISRMTAEYRGTYNYDDTEGARDGSFGVGILPGQAVRDWLEWDGHRRVDDFNLRTTTNEEET